MPTGMSRCGFRASCAAVLTASKPMYAKNTTAAPVMTPAPAEGAFDGKTVGTRAPAAGSNGCQLAGFTAWIVPTMKTSTTATFTKTMTLLTLADSLMPTTSKAVMIAMMMTAGRLKTAVTVVPSASVTGLPCAALSLAGRSMPMSCRKDKT